MNKKRFSPNLSEKKMVEKEVITKKRSSAQFYFHSWMLLLETSCNSPVLMLWCILMFFLENLDVFEEPLLALLAAEQTWHWFQEVV